MFSRLWRRKAADQPVRQSEPSAPGLEEIHRLLKGLNSRLWKELRGGSLAGCHALLYSVQLQEMGERLDWRDVNRKTVAALQGFEKTAGHRERYLRLEEALERLGQKLLIVQLAAKRKSHRLEKEEKKEIERVEAELRRLWGLLRFHLPDHA